MSQLAIFGGPPVRKEKIYYGRQYIDQQDVDAVSAALCSPLITQGPRVFRLEEALCTVTGAKYCVAVANGTAGLHLACLAAGLGPGDEVITTPLTFAASANCALYCGATPVFADIDPLTYNISAQHIRRAITPRTKAVVAVDYTGQPVQLDEIKKICEEYALILIEDAAHSIGSRYRGQPVGALADYTVFSFHPVKTVTGGEGGAVLTNNEAAAHRLQLFRTHGITKNPAEFVQDSAKAWYYEQQELGYNYRLTDFQAALITSQLQKLPWFIARRKEIVAQYNAAFTGMDTLVLQQEIPQADTCRHLYVVQLSLANLSCTRQTFFDALSAENVQPQVHYIPVYWMPYYQKLGYARGHCPNAETLYEKILSIPLYPGMTEEDVQDVICAVKKVTHYFQAG